MNLTDELRKLSELRQQGHLTDEEYAAAKRQLLGLPAAAPDTPVTANGSELEPDTDADVAIDPASGDVERVYRSSRWSAGNTFFPDSIRLTREGMMFRKGRLFGSDYEHINYRAIASVKVNNGMLLSNVTIETSGGSQAVHLNGLWRSDAKEIQEGIRAMQQRVREKL